jgi:predicted nucleic acid-binding protein
MKTEIFLDAAYAIALSSSRDRYHNKAVELAQQLKEANTKLVTTRAILLEIGNALSKTRYRPAAIQLLNAIESDPNIGIVPLTETIYAQAFNLYQNRLDKEWGLVDCISFIVMQERDISQALTTDDHFRQAGFIPLLQD